MCRSMPIKEYTEFAKYIKSQYKHIRIRLPWELGYDLKELKSMLIRKKKI